MRKIWYTKFVVDKKKEEKADKILKLLFIVFAVVVAVDVTADAAGA